MDDDQLLRYSRHILLPELGIEGQERLRSAHVLIVGAGGLGCPAALYLAASGVGRITLADPDQIDLTNLQRQILYRTRDVGAAKASSARAALQETNPDVEVRAIESRLAGEELDRLVGDCDLVLDCCDNFATRHAVNRASVRFARPLVSGAAIRFDGQIAVFDPRQPDAACYACLFPEDPAPEETNCALMGVLAPLTGIIGAMQAAEAMKLITGAGPATAGRLLLVDALNAEIRKLKIPRDPACSICGQK